MRREPAKTRLFDGIGVGDGDCDEVNERMENYGLGEEEKGWG